MTSTVPPQKSIRVCMISGSWPPAVCGVADGINLLSKYLIDESAIDIHIITTKGYNTVEYPSKHLSIHDVVKSWGISAYFPITRALRKIKPDVIHIQFPTNEYRKNLFIYFFVILARLKGYKVISTIHEYSYNRLVSKLSLLPVILFSNIILVPDSRFKNEINHSHLLLTQRIEIIPIAPNIPASTLDNEGKLALKKQLGIKVNDIVLSFFGHINDNKLFLPLLLSIQMLEESYQTHSKLYVITKMNLDNPNHKALVDQVNRMNLSEKVIFTGYLPKEDVANYLSIADYVVLLYRTGISPRNATFLSATCQQVKIITTPNPNYTPPYKYTYIVKNDAHIVDQLCKVMQQNNNTSVEGINGKNLFDSSWRKFARKHLSIYRRLLCI